MTNEIDLLSSKCAVYIRNLCALSHVEINYK